MTLIHFLLVMAMTTILPYASSDAAHPNVPSSMTVWQLSTTETFINVQHDQSLVLECNLRSTRVRWYHNNTRLNCTDRILRQPQAGWSDTGWYSCRRRPFNQPGYTYIVVVVEKLNPSEPIMHRVQERNTSVHYLAEGGFFSKRCLQPKDNSPAMFSWFKDGQSLRSQTSSYRTQWNSSTLTLWDVELKYAGAYMCITSYSSGLSVSISWLNVVGRTRSKPIIDGVFPSNSTVLVGSRVSMECRELTTGAGASSFPFGFWHFWGRSRPNIEAVTGQPNGTQGIPQLLLPNVSSHVVTNTSTLVTRLELASVIRANTGWYSCFFQNYVGSSMKSTYLSVIDQPVVFPQGNGLQTVVIVSISAAVLIVIVVISCVVCFRVRTHRKRAKKTHQVILLPESVQDIPMPSQPLVALVPSVGGDTPSQALLTNQLARLSSRSRTSHGSLLSSVNNIEAIPYDPRWEVPRENIEVLETLGEGEFGLVMKIHLSYPGRPKATLAIKTLKEDSSSNDLTDLISELETMKRIGHHRNIINLIGCSSINGPLFVIVEYAPFGNLRQFLRQRRPNADGVPVVTVMPCLCTKDLVNFCSQVAKGMEYLSSMRCVHRDLAARNILVGDKLVIKIADFGLARRLTNTDYYRKVSDGRLPVKWLAIEALTDRLFSTQGDVWSFGVVLWEVFTMGGFPYPSIHVENLLPLLRSGYRMAAPDGCPPAIYSIMSKCWDALPNRRPTFSDLVKYLEDIIESMCTVEYCRVVPSNSNQPEAPEDEPSTNVAADLLVEEKFFEASCSSSDLSDDVFL